jgi:hypothetical protein
MANSPYQDTVLVMDFLNAVSPASILDVGAGFGRWGFLCRCHLGPGESLTATPRQDLRIEAIEIFSRNINPVYDAVYDKVHKGDARVMLSALGNYDVILCGHVIEHFEKDEAWRFISEMKSHAKIAVILALPFNDGLREGVCGNPNEAHLSVWDEADFRGGECYVKSFPFVREVRAGVVIMPLNDVASWKVRQMKSCLRRWFSKHCSWLAGWHRKFL